MINSDLLIANKNIAIVIIFGTLTQVFLDFLFSALDHKIGSAKNIQIWKSG